MQKIIYIINLVCSISVIILASLSIMGVWKDAASVYIPLLGVSMITQTIQNWKTNKVIAIVFLCCGIFVFGVWGVVMAGRVLVK